MAMKPKRRRYSRDEWIVLVNYFFAQPESTHTDSHPALVEFADSIGRVPSSVDRNLRTVKMYWTKSAGLEHGAQTMREVVDEYKSDFERLKQDASQALGRIPTGL